VRGNVYHLIEFADSPSGTFSGDIQRSDGTFLRPNWETQLQIGWARGGWDARWTWNWQDKTIIRSAGTPVTIEQQNIIGYPDWSLHDASVSYEVTDGLEIVAVVNNVFDTNYAGERGRLVGQYVDQIGRRYSLAIRAEF
jgi:outer membrane receptor protein involved in Fe transport